MSDNSIISGVQSEEEQQPLNYLSHNKNEQIKAFAQEKQNWGKNKAKYYKEDAKSVDSDAEIEEEMEAKALQLKIAKKVQDADLWDNQVDYEEQIPQKIEITNLYNSIAIQCLSDEIGIEPHIIQNLNTKELNNHILKGWPELKGILKEIDSVGKQIQKLKKLIKQSGNELIKYYNVRIQLFQSYLALLFFYLQLRSKTKLSQNHPIFKKINDIKQSIEDSQNYEKFAQLLQMNVDEKEKVQKQNKIIQKQEQQYPQSQEGEDTLTLKRKLKTLYNKKNKEDVNEKKITKIRKLLEDVDKKHQSDQKVQQESEESKISINSEDMIDALQDEQGQDEIYQENLNRIKQQKKQKRYEKKQEKLDNFNKLSKLQSLQEVKEDDPRKITYVMLKNISLMRRRRGNRIKNSRVKHKLKYEKALYKLKSQNKYLKNPQSNYVGEGAIKSGIVKGVRLQ